MAAITTIVSLNQTEEETKSQTNTILVQKQNETQPSLTESIENIISHILTTLQPQHGLSLNDIHLKEVIMTSVTTVTVAMIAVFVGLHTRKLQVEAAEVNKLYDELVKAVSVIIDAEINKLDLIELDATNMRKSTLVILSYNLSKKDYLVLQQVQPAEGMLINQDVYIFMKKRDTKK
jgi:hypothetical protein